MPADFHFRSSHWLGLSSIVSTTYTYCKKLLLNIELAVKIGSRLIERLPLLDFLQRWSEKAKATIDPHTPAIPSTQEPGNQDQLFGIEKLKGIAVRDSMKLLLLRWFQLS